MTRKSKKQFENQSQSGRSMIEMLGVLAIIAILSIGGIVGYKLAMNYYQADQIANEINLMRNDLKVKYALGNEELLLGDPYDDTPEDENYSGHLSTQYNRYPVDYDCIRKDKAEFYNCRETDAYYIKVGNVSKGVCKPLTTLLNGMDALMYIEINNEVYKEDDLCTSDEANEFYIQFDAEEVNGNYDSNRPEGWCGDDKDCDASRPVCDIENNECVECTENADCKDSSRPRCNVEQGNCESCPSETPVWLNNECVECETDEDCLAKGTEKPVCNTTEGKCEPCPDGQQWKESAQGCVAYECRTNEDCNPDGGFEKYCYLKHGVANSTSEWQDDDPNGENYSGECHKVSDDLLKEKPTNIQNINFYGSNKEMNWWSSCRFCAARAKTSDEGCVGTAEGPSFMLGYTDIDWQCYNNELTFHSGVGYFCKGTDANPGNYNVSSTIKKFRKMFDNDENYTGGRFIWFKERNYQGMNLHSGGVGVGFNGERRWSTNNWDRAVCRDRN